MDELRLRIINSGLSVHESQHLISLINQGSSPSLISELERLLIAGHNDLTQSICEHFISQHGTDPEIFITLGSVWQRRGELQKAGFYYFAAFLMGKYVPAATKVLEVFKETNLPIPGLLFSRTLDSETDPGLARLKEHFEEFACSVTSTNEEKSHFIVSHLRATQIRDTRKVFLAEPFLLHLRQRDRCDAQTSSVDVAPSVRRNKDDLRAAVDIITEKNEKYLSILSERLNAIHNLTFGKRFWRKAFGMALIRHITLLYDFFLICEQNFDPLKHTCEALSSNGYHIPLDYDEHRWFLQHQNFGQEQLLSLYLRTFYPGMASSYEERYKYEYKISQVGHFQPNQPKVGIMCAFFAPHFHNALVSASHGEINSIGFDRHFPFDIYDRKCNPEARSFLAQPPPGADRFDRFFFSTLPELMPRVFVEYFGPVISSINAQLSRYTRLEFAVSEMWLSETYESLALALLAERGIKHIYNEHNYIEYPYYANQLKLQASVPDIFLAHGSYKTSIASQVSAGSLFDFTAGHPSFRKANKILYISGIGVAKYSNYSHAYLETSEHAHDYYYFKRQFFESISGDVRQSLLYRGYPRDEWSRMWELNWDDSYMMRGLLDGIRIDDHAKSGKERIAESELIVVDYISTSILEAFSMNVPTIFFLRRNSVLLSDEHANLFTELLEVGVAQDDPLKAADFIEKIRHNPSDWWWMEKVQAARSRFIAKTLGKPEDALLYYLGLTQAHAQAM